MPNKIKVEDYGVTKGEARAYVAFMLWLTSHPQGGIFQYEKFIIRITKQ
jgi:hypothetical protein